MAVHTTRMPSCCWAQRATSRAIAVLPLPVGLSTITERAAGSCWPRSMWGPENISITRPTTRC